MAIFILWKLEDIVINVTCLKVCEGDGGPEDTYLNSQLFWIVVAGR